MTVKATLEIRFKPDDLDKSYAILHEILTDTRAFEGNESVEVLIDRSDPTHIVVLETWRSIEDDSAYRAWRKGAGAAPAAALGPQLTGPPALTILDPSGSI